MTQRFSIQKLVSLFAIVAIVGFSAVVAISNWALNDLRVGGPLYGKITARGGRARRLSATA